MKAKDIFFSILLLVPVGIFAQPEIILNSYPDFMRHKSPELLAEIAGEWVPISATSFDSSGYNTRVFFCIGKTNAIKINGVVNIYPDGIYCFKMFPKETPHYERIEYFLKHKYNLF
jgi:hypothetical protein